MSKSVQKHCLLLKALNIPVDGGYEGIGICQVCPLPYCIQDRPGKVSKENREALERILAQWEPKSGEKGLEKILKEK